MTSSLPSRSPYVEAESVQTGSRKNERKREYIVVNRIGRKLKIGGVIAALLVGGLAAPASATEPVEPEPTPVATEESVLSDEQAAELELLYGATDPAARAFDADLAVASGASPEGTADYAAVLTAEGWDVRGETVDPSAGAREVAGVAAACTGVSGYTGYYGWGWQWGLNSCQTDTLIAAVFQGAGGAAAIGGVFAAIGLIPAAAPVGIPAAVISGAVGGVIAFGGLSLTTCKTASYGVHAIYLNLYYASVGCWGQ